MSVQSAIRWFRAIAAAAVALAAACTPDAGEGERGVAGTRQQVFEAWLATDAAVLGAYLGIDSTLAPGYHATDVERVFAGSPATGRLVFKAPRGIRAHVGDRVLLFLWDRLAGAPDSYLEEAKSRHGDHVWDAIGHDSLAAYLLPFPTYAYPLSGDHLVLRGRSPFPVRRQTAELAADFTAWEESHTPQRLYARTALVVRARVAASALEPRLQHGIVAEWRVHCDLTVLETYKGEAPEPLVLSYISFPRAPRLRTDDELVLFLEPNETGTSLVAGKRGVFHVTAGEVVEVGRPLPEFVKQMRGG